MPPQSHKTVFAEMMWNLFNWWKWQVLQMKHDNVGHVCTQKYTYEQMSQQNILAFDIQYITT